MMLALIDFFFYQNRLTNKCARTNLDTISESQNSGHIVFL